MAEQISNNMAAVFFLEKNIADDKLKVILDELNKSSLVLRTQFVTSEQAVNKFNEKFPELKGVLANLEENPFPSSIEVTFKEKSISMRETSGLITRIANLSGVEDVQFNQNWVERMHSFSRLSKAVGLFLGGILVLASFFIISNVIKLNVFSRKDEIGILRLVGATNMFIRIPFLLEGISLGIIGSITSILLLALLINSFPLYLGASLGVLNDLIAFRFLTFSQSITLIVAGAFTGFVGSLSSLARFLKV